MGEDACQYQHPPGEVGIAKYSLHRVGISTICSLRLLLLSLSSLSSMSAGLWLRKVDAGLSLNIQRPRHESASSTHRASCMIQMNVDCFEQVILNLVEIGDGLNGCGIHTSPVVERLEITHHSNVYTLASDSKARWQMWKGQESVLLCRVLRTRKKLERT